jgi:hypothetical protein
VTSTASLNSRLTFAHARNRCRDICGARAVASCSVEDMQPFGFPVGVDENGDRSDLSLGAARTQPLDPTHQGERNDDDDRRGGGDDRCQIVVDILEQLSGDGLALDA